MARKKSNGRSFFQNPFRELKRETVRGVLAVIFFVLALFFLLSAFDSAGVAGRYAKAGFSFLLGVGYYLIPLLLILLSLSMYKEYEERRIGLTKTIASSLFLFSGLALIEFAADGQGGVLGTLVAAPLRALFDAWASLVVLTGLAVVSIMILFDTHLRISLPSLSFPSFSTFSLFRKRTGAEEIPAEPEARGELPAEESGEHEEVATNELPTPEATEQSAPEKTESAGERLKEMLGLSREKPEQMIFEAYVPPPLSLLSRDDGRASVGNTKDNANIIKRTLQNFGIRVEIDEINVGPTVTRYAIKPAEGVRVGRIVGLQNNLELALAAESGIRIEAPIPGKSLVGIEVPNRTKSILGLRDLLENPDFARSERPLLVTLGRDIVGQPVYTDISKMPHLLIAGATNSGKSVTIHAIIMSLLYRNGPRALRFIMVDPKRVELTLYNNIPHLQAPVITKAKDAISALKWAASEMDRRLSVFEAEQVRDIASYHQNILAPALKEYERGRRKARGDETGTSPEELATLPETMPYLVVVIEELSDLMGAYPRELEAIIVRLAQLARATGIHLILATQRPEVKVITGLIKANVPARIALSVNSNTDSRTILDAGGAEKLSGKGDLLYLSSDAPKARRLQAPYVSEKEVKKVVAFLAKQDLHTLNDHIDFKNIEQSGDGIFAGSVEERTPDVDPKYLEAKQLVIETQKASTSFIQTRLVCGYQRAARIMQQLEENGIIGPQNGSKPREVLVSNDAKVTDETSRDHDEEMLYDR